MRKERACSGFFKGKTSVEYHKSYRERNPEQMLLSSARSRAKKKNIPFSITIKDIDIPDVCPILGIPLVRHFDQHGGLDDSPSIDRIVPELGYVPGNIQVVSRLANSMKSNATKEQLLLFAEWIMEKYNAHFSRT